MGIVTRIKTLDALKFFTIFFVVWGHCIQYLNNKVYTEEAIYRIIYAFHMPLFMMIAGFFSEKSLTLKFHLIIGKKARQLLLPCFAWVTISWICVSIVDTVRGIDISFTKLFEGYLYQFWFLKSLFICYILVFIGNKGGKVGYFITLLLSQFITYSGTNTMYPCFLIGLWLSRKARQPETKIIKYRFVGATLFIFMLFFFDERFFPYQGNLFSGNVELVSLYTYRLVLGILGSFSFMSFFCIDLKEFRFPKFIYEWGQYTLGIYILQSFILERFIGRLVTLNMGSFLFVYIVSPLISMAIICLCTYIIKIIKCSPQIRLFLLGEK